MQKISAFPILFVCAFGSVGFSQTYYTNAPWIYSLNDSNEATIVRYEGTGGHVRFPPTLDGYPVKTVGDGQFALPSTSVFGSSRLGNPNTTVTGVDIPDSVTRIGDGAFENCTALTNVTLPNTITFIPSWAFAYCEALTNIVIPSSVTNLWSYAFAYCSGATNMLIGSSVHSINYAAFEGMTGLTRLNLPASVTFLGPHVFNGCTNLKEIYFMGNAPSVEYGVFWWLPVGTVYYPTDSNGWNTTFEGWPTRVYSISASDLDQDGVTHYREEKDGTNPNDPSSFNPLSKGLVAYYPFDGNADDESGNNYHGTIHNNAATTADRFYNKQSAYYFDGVNQYIEYPKFGLDDARTFSGWVKFPEAEGIWTGVPYTGRPEITLIGQMSISSGKNWHFHLIGQQVSDNDPRAFTALYHTLGPGDDNAPYAVYSTARDNGWHHYVAVHEPHSTNALKVTLFINGVEVGQVSSRIPDELDSSYQSMRLPKADTSVHHQEGSLDDLRVYNRALSLTEVKQLYYQEAFNGEQHSFLSVNARVVGHYSQDDYDLNRTNGQSDVTTNPSAFNLFTQTQFDDNRTAGRLDVINNPMPYGLYTADSIMDLRMDGLMIPKAGGVATIAFQPQTTTNLATEPFTNNGAPITFEIPLSANHGFMRVEAKPFATPVPQQP